jgi:hypothetical protein
MAPFHLYTVGTAGHWSRGRFLTRLQTHAPSRNSVSSGRPQPASANHLSSPQIERIDQPRSLLGTLLSRFRHGRHDVNEQPNPTTDRGQTDAGKAAAPAPPDSEPKPSLIPHQTSWNCETETACQDLAQLVDPRSSDTRASASSREDGEDSSLGSDDDDGDDAYSIDTELISDYDGDAEEGHQYVKLGADNYALKQWFLFFGTSDTGASLSVMSCDKARLVAPGGPAGDFSHLGKRTMGTAGGDVTVHGPIWVKFWLWNEGPRRRYRAPFYVLPRSYSKGAFDALLSIKVVQRLGLVQIRRDPAVEGPATAVAVAVAVAAAEAAAAAGPSLAGLIAE